MNKNILMINHHIPRCIFGVKYTAKSNTRIDFNLIKRFDTKKEQLYFMKDLEQYPTLYEDIKPLKWLIKP